MCRAWLCRSLCLHGCTCMSTRICPVEFFVVRPSICFSKLVALMSSEVPMLFFNAESGSLSTL